MTSLQKSFVSVLDFIAEEKSRSTRGKGQWKKTGPCQIKANAAFFSYYIQHGSVDNVPRQAWTKWVLQDSDQENMPKHICSSLVRRHSVWKSQKKSHSTLRAKRAMFAFWVEKSSLKCKKCLIWANFFLKTWSFQSNSVTRQVNFNRTKNWWKCQN